MNRIIVSLFASVLFAGCVQAQPAPSYDNDNDEAPSRSTLEMLSLFGDVFDKIREEYVEAPEDEELIEAAINGMLTSLDPHSSFLNAEDFAEMNVETKGQFGGLGIEVSMKNGLVYVVSPIDDTPAYRAGIEAGDYISHIDDESVIGMTLRDAVKLMRGKPKTPITLTILRESEDEPFDVTFKRDIIKIQSVKSDTYGDDVIYVRVSRFSENTGLDVKNAIKDRRAELEDGAIKGVVLDLRNNPGGLLTQAIEVSDLFLEQGEVVSTRGRNPESTKRFDATRGDILDDLPIVVLINGGSASASEIVAGALQDHRRAVVVGEQSFGKASVQTIMPVDFDSAIRITTARYYTPSGRSIQAEGIVPDVEIRNAEVTLKKERKRIKEADLKGQIGKNDEERKERVDGHKKRGQKELTAKEIVDGKTEKTLVEEDYQLAHALDMLRGLYIFNNRHAAPKLEAVK